MIVYRDHGEPNSLRRVCVMRWSLRHPPSSRRRIFAPSMGQRTCNPECFVFKVHISEIHLLEVWFQFWSPKQFADGLRIVVSFGKMSLYCECNSLRIESAAAFIGLHQYYIAKRERMFADFPPFWAFFGEFSAMLPIFYFSLSQSEVSVSSEWSVLFCIGQHPPLVSYACHTPPSFA